MKRRPVLPASEDHHPDVDLRHDGVTVRLRTITDDRYGTSRRDVEVARQISAAARKLGLSATPRWSRACWSFLARPPSAR
jgi:4a-hydroxytetrahydrobiopterin dehydratase